MINGDHRPISKFAYLCIVLTALLAGCFDRPGVAVLPEDSTSSVPPLTGTQPPVPPTVTATAVPSPTSTPEPVGCQKPAEDYTQVEVNGWMINQRTLTMLSYTRELYTGELEITGYGITQGSYHDNGSASFGTHLGGGAVDLSVMRHGTYTVLWEDVEPLIHALRATGFAAWLREYGELYADSPIHIHVIAIGDAELSPAAEEQLTGVAGYFRGFNGLHPKEDGIPIPDRYGGPIICQWMIDLGYRDLR